MYWYIIVAVFGLHADHDLKQFSVIPSVALIVGLGSSTLKSTEVILSTLEICASTSTF